MPTPTPLRGMSWHAELRMVSPTSDARGTQAIGSRMATRRGILQGLLAGLLARGARGARKQAGGAPPGNVPKGKYRIPADARAQTRELGRTGVRVSILGLGGYHLGNQSDPDAVDVQLAVRAYRGSLRVKCGWILD